MSKIGFPTAALAVATPPAVPTDEEHIAQILQGVGQRIDLALGAVGPGDRDIGDPVAVSPGDEEQLNIEGGDTRQGNRIGIPIEKAAGQNRVDGRSRRT